jgi:hypothetical protein
MFRKVFVSEKNDRVGAVGDSDFDPLAPLFGDDFEPVTTPIKGYEPPPASPEMLALVKEFESQIEEIHAENFPEWEQFFGTARKLENEYFGDYGQSTALSDELMSVYELMDVEALYADDKFVAQLVKILPEDVHFACFLLNSEYTDRVSAISLADMLNVLLDSQTPMDCYGCAMNRWWGNPIAYLAVNPNTNSLDLQRIFEIAIIEPDEFSRDITLCSLAQNPSTPTEVIKQLASMDRDSLLAGDDQCPFYNPNNKLSVNISYWAKKQLDQRFSV